MATTKKKTRGKATTTPKASPKASGKASSKASGKAHENARNVFLAGLGAYGKAFEEAQAQLKENREKLVQRRDKANELFDKLVKRGEQVESDTMRRIKDLDLPELKVGELKLTGPAELRADMRARLDKARESFNTLLDAVSVKSNTAGKA